MSYAGFWKRAIALLIDGLITGAVVFLLSLVAGNRMANIMDAVIGWLYFALLESSASQATLGKRLIGIKVTDLDGNKIGFGKATVRYFAKIISGLILGIGFLMAAFTQRKQALHDMIAGTLVINK